MNSILMSEGSSLSARQAISALGPLGYRIDACDSNPMCIGRFSRFVRHFHRCPAWAADPKGYLDFILGRLDTDRYDVLLPVHEQAFLFAAARDRLAPRAGIALADFQSFLLIQSKTAFARLLDQIGLPQPPTRPARSSRNSWPPSRRRPRRNSLSVDPRIRRDLCSGN